MPRPKAIKRGGNKRAQFILSEIIFQIGQLLILIILLVSLLYLVTQLSSTRILEKHKITRDTALVMDTLYAAPGKIYWSSTINFTQQKLKVNIEPKRVVVLDVS